MFNPIQHIRALAHRYDSEWDQSLASVRKTRRINPQNVLRIAFEPLSLQTEDGEQLAAWWIPAIASEHHRAVLMHHFMGGCKEAMLPWIKLFHRLGFSILCFDARCHGTSSGGRPESVTYSQRVFDVFAATAEIKKRGDFDILGFGQSMGSAVMTLAEQKRPFAKALLWDSGPSFELFSPTYGFTRSLRHREQFGRRLQRLYLARRLLKRASPLRYTQKMSKALLHARHIPTLWIHGTADVVLRRQNVLWWWKIILPGAPHWNSLALKDVDHVAGIRQARVEVSEAVERFVLKHL